MRTRLVIPGQVETYRVGRDLGKEERPAFESIVELEYIGKQMGADVKASASSTRAYLITPEEGLRFQGAHGIGFEAVVSKMQAMRAEQRRKQSEIDRTHPSIARLGNDDYLPIHIGLDLQIGDEVQVYEAENSDNIHLGIPILGKHAVTLAQERIALFENLSTFTDEDMTVGTSLPYLTVGIVKNGNKQAADILKFVAQDLLWPDNGQGTMHDTVFTYAPDAKYTDLPVAA